MHLVREAVTWAERSLELTDSELGQALGVSSRSIARWRSARNAPNARNIEAAEQLLELAQALTARFGADRKALHEWLHQPLPALKRRSPLRAIIAGDVARVVTLLANAESGTFA
jgi:putative toxin-antitoxin system antitoxin component (TIGR02293 family)